MTLTSMIPITPITPALLLTLALTGCLGGSSPYCEETITILESADSPTPADKTAADILALIEGEHVAEFAWTEQGGDGVRVEVSPGGSGTTPLTLSIDHQQGEVRWVDSELVDPPGPNNEIDVNCLPRLEIDAKLGFTTEDGAFAELFDVVVKAEANYEGELHWASILHVFDPAQLAGMLEVLSVEPEDPDEIEYHVDFGIPLDEYTDLEPGVPRGYVDGFATYEGHGPAPAGTVAVGMLELGSFGPVESEGQ
ncbi:hypothetical protein ACNOYE_01350 [Nannocystaceae bacterium ST9]